MKELFERDKEGALNKLTKIPVTENRKLRPYQLKAIIDTEKAIISNKRQMLIAMATGTGKTFLTVSQVYRFLDSGIAKRVLFLVDRKALAAQAVRTFSSFDTPKGLKFDTEYEVYSQSFRKDDFGDDEPFNPKILPNEYLTKPGPEHTFVYVCTIQRMALNLYGKDAISAESLNWKGIFLIVALWKSLFMLLGTNLKRNMIKKTMWIILYVFVFILLGTVIFFNAPYSKTKSEFNKMVSELTGKTNNEKGVFTQECIQDLPVPVKRYFQYCGYLGTPKMSYMKASYKNVPFIMSSDKPPLKIDYTHYNFVKEPIRIAFIDSALLGIPFEGLDSYKEGVGSMKGVIAKLFTLFDQRGPEMDKASLVTCLAEALIIPNVALQDYIAWEEIDDSHAKATISYYGISASGIFTFNEIGEMISFTTNDRRAVKPDGTMEQVSWSAVCRDYKESNGIRQPTTMQAVWHFNDGDVVYFDSKNLKIEYE